ncbi:Oligopeptide/dipeptide transporter, C-terminal region [Lachnospiraceae bacterium XBB1006]|nr:Oligopeptide/dipeptide transporter, C-terminal region [Lachnospiraceae bacterium XBB1006]
MSCLQMREVEIAYGDKQVVSGISLSIKQGQIVGIVGESGSGKSTLLKSVLGLLGPTGHITKGQIFFQGQDMTAYGERDYATIRGKEIAMIFQNPEESFDPNQTLGNQFYESMRAHWKIKKNEALEEAKIALSKLGFSDPSRILKTYPFALSGGMNQRVAIALAMIKRPSLLLADEPTSALDVTVQKETLDVLKRLCDKEQTSLLLVTHNMGVVRYIADYVVVMYHGKIVEEGGTKEIFECPCHPYTKQLMEHIPKPGKEAVWNRL